MATPRPDQCDQHEISSFKMLSLWKCTLQMVRLHASLHYIQLLFILLSLLHLALLLSPSSFSFNVVSSLILFQRGVNWRKLASGVNGGGIVQM